MKQRTKQAIGSIYLGAAGIILASIIHGGPQITEFSCASFGATLGVAVYLLTSPRD